MYALDILTALKEIHKHKIIHCDIKPQNFLLFHLNETKSADLNDNSVEEIEEEFEDAASVDSYDPDIILKVMDFGLSHIIDASAEKAYMKQRAGTHEYMAPEIKDVF